ncbi:hypothetical protein HYY70_05850 [Candidatus Woesearchaeota archaeon]|nr:hypothetical protein [Candidatus Woesearchaeota archaeon]
MKAAILLVILAVLLSNKSFSQQPDCDYKVEIISDGDEFEKESFKWRMKAIKLEGKPTNITGTAKIESSDGKTVKSYKPWTSDPISRQKTSNEYSPNLSPGKYKITAEVNVDCIDTNKDNSIDIKFIRILGEIKEKAAEKKKSQNSESIAANTENTQMGNKVSNDVEEPPKAKKTATKVAKPSGEEAENVVELRKENNKKNQRPQQTTANASKSQVVYKSSSEKAKGMIMIFLLSISILLNIILIWKR